MQMTEWFGQALFAFEAQDAWFQRQSSTMKSSLRLYHQQGLAPAGIKEVVAFETASKAIKGLLQQLGDQCYAMGQVRPLDNHPAAETMLCSVPVLTDITTTLP